MLEILFFLCIFALASVPPLAIIPLVAFVATLVWGSVRKGPM